MRRLIRSTIVWILDALPAWVLIAGVYLFGRLEYAIEFAPLA